MNFPSIAEILFFIAAISMGTSVSAQLQLNKKVTRNQIAVKINPLLEAVVRPYGEAHSAVDNTLGKLGVFTNISGSNFGWYFNGKEYYSNVAAYVRNAAPTDECKGVTNWLANDCNWMRMRHLTCHLFMITKELKLEAVSAITINRNTNVLKGYPMCLEVMAMAPANSSQNSMLITLKYIDSAEPAEPFYNPPAFYQTSLLTFKEVNGRLVIEQEDRCLGNPNSIKSITEARRRMIGCQAAAQ